MAAYLIEVDDSKQGVMNPVKVGPFPDDDAAREFANAHQMGNEALDSGRGGYSAVHVVSDATALTPEQFHAEWEPSVLYGAGDPEAADG